MRQGCQARFRGFGQGQGEGFDLLEGRGARDEGQEESVVVLPGGQRLPQLLGRLAVPGTDEALDLDPEIPGRHGFGGAGVHEPGQRGQRGVRCPLAVTPVVLQGLHGLGQDLERPDIGARGQAPEHHALVLEVGQPELLEPKADDGETTVHVADVPHRRPGPEALGDGRRPRPDPGVDRLGGHELGPHGRLAAEDEFSLGLVQGRARGNGIVEIVGLGRLTEVDVVSVR